MTHIGSRRILMRAVFDSPRDGFSLGRAAPGAKGLDDQVQHNAQRHEAGEAAQQASGLPWIVKDLIVKGA